MNIYILVHHYNFVRPILVPFILGSIHDVDADAVTAFILGHRGSHVGYLAAQPHALDMYFYMRTDQGLPEGRPLPRRRLGCVLEVGH